MQVNEDYLDGLFARKLGKLEVSPPDDGWGRIERELTRRSRVMRRNWLTAASLALILSVTATIVYVQTNVHGDTDEVKTVAIAKQQDDLQNIENQIYKNDHALSEKDQMVAQPGENTIMKEEKTTSTVVSPATNMQTISHDEPAVSDISEKASSTRSDVPVYVDSWDEILKMQPVKPNWGKLMSENNARIRMEMPENKADETIANGNSTIPRYDDISGIDLTSSFTRPRPRNRWEIIGQFAPVYSYRAISSVPNGMEKYAFDEAESPLLAYSGGVTVSRKVLNRLDVQIGVYYIQMGQSINNLIPVTNMYSAVSSNNSYNKNFVKTSSGSVTVASNLKSDVNTTYANYFNPESQNASSTANIVSSAKYKLIEQIVYFEIPFTLRYRFFDKKMNMYVLGGMSANILINNDVLVDNGKELVRGGTILMARPVNYSSTVGFGLGYHFSQNFEVVFEPLFKYYLQPYTTNSQIGSNPYAFGLFTGIVYKF